MELFSKLIKFYFLWPLTKWFLLSGSYQMSKGSLATKAPEYSNTLNLERTIQQEEEGIPE